MTAPPSDAVLGPANAETFKSGGPNADAINERSRRHRLSSAATDVGGTTGRALELRPATGTTFVRTAASPAREL
jgi:chemotaxis receptor (MCP) glutamine deamidase CheD